MASKKSNSNFISTWQKSPIETTPRQTPPKVVPFTDGEQHVAKRFGFMAGEITVPDDFDSMSAAAIAELFEGAKEGILPV